MGGIEAGSGLELYCLAILTATFYFEEVGLEIEGLSSLVRLSVLTLCY